MRRTAPKFVSVKAQNGRNSVAALCVPGFIPGVSEKAIYLRVNHIVRSLEVTAITRRMEP